MNKPKTPTESMDEPPPTASAWSRKWDQLNQNVDELLKDGNFGNLFLFLGLAADRDEAFRDELIALVEKLKPDGRNTWTNTERHLIVIHYAHAVHDGESDPIEWLCGYVERNLKRQRPVRATMENELSKACARIDLNSLPEWARQVVENRLKAGDVRRPKKPREIPNSKIIRRR